jgi:ABC-type transport system involved in cytochrome bd biosynthesis fused ATPase/permease subunit
VEQRHSTKAFLLFNVISLLIPAHYFVKMDASATTTESPTALHINVNNLTFRYQPDQRPILNNLNMQLTDGARCLLIGANGAGLLTSIL